MQSFLEFSTNKSCPQLSCDYILLTDSLNKKKVLSNKIQPLNSCQRLRGTELESIRHDLNAVAMTTMQDDAIEILSCHVEQDEEDDIPDRHAIIPIKLVNGETLSDDPTNIHRKRVVRAVGAVTFLLLFFSILLIGISLNMSKDIDELVRQSNLGMRNPQFNFVTRKENVTQ